MIEDLLAQEGTPASSAPSSSEAPASASTPDTSSAGTIGESAGQSGMTQAEQQAFYEYQFDDGKKVSAKTKKDLDDFIRGGVLRRDHFDKNNQKLAEQRKTFEQKEQDLSTAFATVKQLEAKYKPIDEFYSQRPELMREIVARFKGSSVAKAQPQEDPKWKEFEEFKSSYEKEKSQAATQAQRQQIYSAMKARYGDFNEEGINSALGRILDAAPGDEMASLVDLVYWSEKGRATPAQIEETMRANLEKKQGMKAPMTSGGNTPVGRPGFKSLDAAAEAAKSRYGG